MPLALSVGIAYTQGMNTIRSVQSVIDEAGGVASLARKLGVTPPTVSQWSTGKRPVPARLAIAIADLYPGLATTSDLRPDIFGPPTEQPDQAEEVGDVA